MSECLSEAWRGYARQPPSARILMGGFYVVIVPTEGNSSFLQNMVLLLALLSARPAIEAHGQPMARPTCAFVLRAPSLSTPAFSSYVIDDSIHNPPKIFRNVSSTRLITFSLFRFMATNCFVPSLHPLPPS